MLFLVLLIPLLLPFLLRRVGPTLTGAERIFLNASGVPILTGFVAPAILAANDTTLQHSAPGRNTLAVSGACLSGLMLVSGAVLIILSVRRGEGAKPPLLAATLVAGLPLLLVILVGVLWLGHG